MATTIASLRRELYTLRGHYNDMGASLDALQRIRNAVEDLDDKLTSLEHSSMHRKSPARVVGEKVDLELHNGYDIPVKTLVFDRLRTSSGTVPLHVERSMVFEALVSTDLEARVKRFCDPDQTPLDIPAVAPGPDIMLPRDVQDTILKAQELARIRDEQRRKELTPDVLGRVQLWRRLSRLCADPTLFGRGNDLLLLRPGGVRLPPQASQTLPKFEKGLFEDDWFLLALAVVATCRPTLAHLFASAQHRALGMYTFQFYQQPDPLGENAGWKCITIDDMVPCAPARRNTDGRVEYAAEASGSAGTGSVLPILGLTDQPNELWGVLVEKAYAKFLGSYSHLHRGDTSQAMTHLTGGDCQLLQWDADHIDETALAVLWWTISESARLGLLQCCVKAISDENTASGQTFIQERCSSSFMEWTGGDVVILTAEITPGKLYEMHAGARERIGLQDDEHWSRFHKEGAKLIKIGNLLGADEWEGEWSHTSPLWTPAARDAVGYGSMDEHIAWMKVRDFSRQYNTLLTCSNFYGGPLVWLRNLEARSPLEVRRHHEQFLINVTPGQGWNADQPGYDSDEEDPLLSVTLYCSQPNKEDSVSVAHHNYADGADRPEEIEINLFRVSTRDVVRPIQKVVEEEEWQHPFEDGAPEPTEDEGLYWPDVAEELVDVETAPGSFVTCKRAYLSPGWYVLTVGQSELDAEQSVRCAVAVFNDEDMTGRTRSPFVGGAKPGGGRGTPSPGRFRGPSPNPRSPKRRKAGHQIDAEAIGTAADPRLERHKPRPQTPYDRLQQRVEAAQARPGSSWSHHHDKV